MVEGDVNFNNLDRVKEENALMETGRNGIGSLGSVWLCFLPLQASLVVWVIILRFMGDLPEPAMFAKNATIRSGSVMTQIYDTLGRKNQVQFRNDSPNMVRGAGYVCIFICFPWFLCCSTKSEKSKETLSCYHPWNARSKKGTLSVLVGYCSSFGQEGTKEKHLYLSVFLSFMDPSCCALN